MVLHCSFDFQFFVSFHVTVGHLDLIWKNVYSDPLPIKFFFFFLTERESERASTSGGERQREREIERIPSTLHIQHGA